MKNKRTHSGFLAQVMVAGLMGLFPLLSQGQVSLKAFENELIQSLRGSLCGHSVAYSASEDHTLTLIGCPFLGGDDIDQETHRGAVLIFGQAGGSNSGGTAALLLPSEARGQGYSLCGFSIAAYAQTIMVSCAGMQGRDGVHRVGAVFVFELQEGHWVQVSKLIPKEAGERAFCGTDVEFDGKYALVTCGTNRETKAIYVFENKGGLGWIERGRIEHYTDSSRK